MRYAAITVALVVCAAAFWALLSHIVADIMVMRFAVCAPPMVARCSLNGLAGDILFYGVIVGAAAATINRLRPRPRHVG